MNVFLNINLLAISFNILGIYFAVYITKYIKSIAQMTSSKKISGFIYIVICQILILVFISILITAKLDLIPTFNQIMVRVGFVAISAIFAIIIDIVLYKFINNV